MANFSIVSQIMGNTSKFVQKLLMVAKYVENIYRCKTVPKSQAIMYHKKSRLYDMPQDLWSLGS